MSKSIDVDTIEEALAKMNEFREWLDGLTVHDRNNFVTLIELKNAQHIIAKMPNNKYQDMAIFALAMRAIKKGNPA